MTATTDAIIAASAAASTLVPAVEPIVLLILAIIKAHQNATGGTFPTPAQVQAALPADSQTLNTLWAQWTAAHP